MGIFRTSVTSLNESEKYRCLINATFSRQAVATYRTFFLVLLALWFLGVVWALFCFHLTYAGSKIFLPPTIHKNDQITNRNSSSKCATSVKRSEQIRTRRARNGPNQNSSLKCGTRAKRSKTHGERALSINRKPKRSVGKKNARSVTARYCAR